MRTTIDLPADLHTLARELAHQQSTTLSEVVTSLIRRGLAQTGESKVIPAQEKGALPTVTVGRPVTAEDVRSLEDEWK